jgi:hypothetical protein
LIVFMPVSPTLSSTLSTLASFATFLMADVATREPLTIVFETSLDPSTRDWLAAREPLARVWLAATDPLTTELPALTRPLPALRDEVATARDPVEKDDRSSPEARDEDLFDESL